MRGPSFETAKVNAQCAANEAKVTQYVWTTPEGSAFSRHPPKGYEYATIEPTTKDEP